MRFTPRDALVQAFRKLSAPSNGRPLPRMPRWEGMDPLEPRTLLSTVEWTGAGGDPFWHNPANWSTNALPGPADDVVIDVAGTPTIVHSQSATAIRSLLSRETIFLTNGSIAVETQWDQQAPLAVYGGTVAGTGDLLLGSFLNWVGGAMTGTGKTSILPGGTLFINGNVSLSRAIVNNGTAVWKSGNFHINNSTFHNLAGRTFTAQGVGQMTAAGTSTFINHGQFIRQGDAGAAVALQVRMHNVGTVDVKQGILVLNDVVQITGATLTGTGAWKASGPAATLVLPSQITAIGANASVLLHAPGSNIPQLAVLAANHGTLTLSGGRAFNFAPAGSVFTNSGTFIRQGPGTWSAIPSTLTFRNNGTVQVQSGILTIQSGGAHAGAFGVLGGATLAFAGTNVFFATSTIDGAGQVSFNAAGQTFHGSIKNVGLFKLLGGTVNLLAPASAASAALHGGLLTGPGALYIGGPLVWTGGTMSGAGATTAVGSMTISGPAIKHLQRTLNSAGQAAWTGGTIRFANGTLNNLQNGTFTATGALYMVDGGGTNIFKNWGTVNKTGEGSVILSGVSMGMALFNGGTVNVQSGWLQLRGGGATSGIISLGNDTTLVLGGTQPYTISAGQVHGPGNITVHIGKANWTGGHIGGSGVFNISQVGGVLGIGGPAQKTLARTMVSRGTVQWLGGELRLVDASIHNLNLATFIVSGSAALTSGGGSNTFLNAANIDWFAAGGTTFGAGTTLSNTGAFNLRSGELSLLASQVAQVVGTTLSAGTWSVLNGAELDFPGVNLSNNKASVSIAGAGSKFRPFDLLGSNQGLIQLIGNAQMAVTTGSFSNFGTIRIGSGAEFNVNGTFAQASVGALQFDAAAPGTHGRMNISGGALPAGTALIVFDYFPAAGETLEIISAGSVGGQFGVTNFTGLPAGLKGQLEYNPQSIKARVLLA